MTPGVLLAEKVKVEKASFRWRKSWWWWPGSVGVAVVQMSLNE